MLRMRFVVAGIVVTAFLAAGAIVLTGLASASAGGSLVGKWKGYLTGYSGQRISLQVTVNHNERAGTWRTGPTCSGTLRLKNISDGYHHYYRVAGKNAGCAPVGIDCLKRLGSGLYDTFSPSSNWNISDNGTLRRVK
jgi:hypothetical protein